MTELMTAEDRRWACQEMMFQWGDDGHYWDYAQWIAQMLEQALDHVEGLVGPEAAAAPLLQLVQPIAANEHSDSTSWREVFEDVLMAGTVWPISERLNDALLYGIFGVTPEKTPLADRAEWIAGLVAEVRSFAARNDVHALGIENNPILRISQLACSRHALDIGEGEVDVHSMSILGRVSEGRVRNLMSGSSAPLERGPEGGVVAMSALSWLQKREGFLRSIWAEDVPATDEMEINETPIIADKMLFVPAARDGSIFNPDLRRSGTYQVGAKGEEQDYTTFEEALAALNTMPVPRWRRPNDNGHWGIVSGVAWQRIERQ